MKHPQWCGNECVNCIDYCDLEKSMPCSPDCNGFDSNGCPTSKDCQYCDAIHDRYGNRLYTDNFEIIIQPISITIPTKRNTHV